MRTPLRVLIVEDSEDDMALLVRELRRGGYDPTFELVDTPAGMTAALGKNQWDLIICDYSMPHFSGIDALSLLRTKVPRLRGRVAGVLFLPVQVCPGNLREEPN